MPNGRNKKDFDQKNLQWLYHNVCYNLISFEAQNFLYPAIEPNYALYGWKKSMKTTLFPNNNPEKDVEMKKIFGELKKRGLLSHDEVKQVELHYHAVSRWSHVAEMIFEFENV